MTPQIEDRKTEYAERYWIQDREGRDQPSRSRSRSAIEAEIVRRDRGQVSLKDRLTVVKLLDDFKKFHGQMQKPTSAAM